jgi:hypothetical protein
MTSHLTACHSPHHHAPRTSLPAAILFSTARSYRRHCITQERQDGLPTHVDVSACPSKLERLSKIEHNRKKTSKKVDGFLFGSESCLWHIFRFIIATQLGALV